jgi:vacuolar-type H+-ATPase subunit I/STV1
MSFVNCVDADADADEKREKRRHFIDFNSHVFEFDDSNDETSFIDVSSRKKSRRKSLFSKKKKKRNFIIRKQKKQIKKTRQLNEKIENHEHALLKK